MDRFTHVRLNGIKTGYWSPKTKEEVVQRLGEYEDTGLEPSEISRTNVAWISTEKELPPIAKAVLVARLYEAGQPLRVEQAILTPGGWWKVYGTNCKKVSFWAPLPAPPEVE